MATKTVTAKKTNTVKEETAAKAVQAEDKVTGKKKAPARKSTTKKEMKVKTVVEFYGRQVEEKEIIANVKKVWTKSGKKIGDIKTMELYIKPEEAAVYYVINGTQTGSVAF